MTVWHPEQFATAGRAEPYREWLAWERETLQPLHGLPMGLEYCDVDWAMDLADRAALFDPRAMPIPATMARILPSGRPAGGIFSEAKLRPLGHACYFSFLPHLTGRAELAALRRSSTTPS